MDLLYPIEVVVAWIMTGIHTLLTMVGLPDGPGLAWVLSIVGLTITIRILLIPLLFRQIKAMRGMQEVQPEMQKIQKKYKGKRDTASQMAMQEELKELYKRHGTSPFSSCLPLLAQMPIFFALFRVLNNLDDVADGTYKRDAIGTITQGVASDIEQSTVFGARLSDWFLMDGADLQVRIVTVILIVAMSVTTFTTQKQLTMKNMSKAALEGPMAQQQKIMLYMLPVIFAVSGINFPVGVLIYWLVSNVWSMGQQWWTIRNHPSPGSEADRQMRARRAAKRAKKGLPPEEETVTTETEVAPQGQRVQPRRKGRGGRPGEVVEQPEPEESPEVEQDEGPVRGKDGLTDQERAQRRYERRAAERAAAREKRKKKGQ